MDALSLTASMTNGNRTFTVTVPSSQFEGARISQIRYTSVWTPMDVPAATSTAPVAGSSATPPEVDDCCVSVTCAVVARIPPSRSLARTFATAVPPADETVALSSAASITYGTRATVARDDGQMTRPGATGIELMTEFVFTLATATTPRLGTVA